MELQLYFYHHEISMSPESIFNIFNDDAKLINAVEKLQKIEYINGTVNDREAGTKAVLQYGGSSIETEITVYRDDRRFEVKSSLEGGTLNTMFNIVPVEDRSEVTISSVLHADSVLNSAKYAVKIPGIKKQFNNEMKRLSDN